MECDYKSRPHLKMHIDTDDQIILIDYHISDNESIIKLFNINEDLLYEKKIDKKIERDFSSKKIVVEY